MSHKTPFFFYKKNKKKQTSTSLSCHVFNFHLILVSVLSPELVSFPRYFLFIFLTASVLLLYLPLIWKQSALCHLLSCLQYKRCFVKFYHSLYIYMHADQSKILVYLMAATDGNQSATQTYWSSVLWWKRQMNLTELWVFTQVTSEPWWCVLCIKTSRKQLHTPRKTLF